jgi:hypothetical protein
LWHGTTVTWTQAKQNFSFRSLIQIVFLFIGADDILVMLSKYQRKADTRTARRYQDSHDFKKEIATDNTVCYKMSFATVIIHSLVGLGERSQTDNDKTRLIVQITGCKTCR